MQGLNSSFLFLVVLLLVLPLSARAEPPAEPRHVSSVAASHAKATQGELSAWDISCSARRLSQGTNLKRAVRLLVGRGASAKPTYTSKLPVGKRGAKVPVQTIEVPQGRVDVVLPASPVPRGVLLQGPDKILGITTGGRLAMVVGDEAVIVAALDGDVLVGIDAKFRPLGAGRLRRIDRATGQAKDHPIATAPELSAESSLQLASTQGAEVNVTIGAVAGAETIRLSVWHRGGQRAIPDVETATGQATLSLPRAGSYFVVARAIDSWGIEGEPSQPLRFRVLGLAPGQRAPSDGVLLIDRGERLRLLGTEGLEMRYGSSPEYYPAGSTLGLPRGEPTIAEYRDPAHPKEKVTVKLAPLLLDAQVFLAPGDAVWPGQPVKMTVRLVDGNNHVLTRRHGFKIDVRVNLEEVPVTWKATRQGFMATLQDRNDQGPWIVRVVVADAKGRQVARGHLEVVDGRPSRTTRRSGNTDKGRHD